MSETCRTCKVIDCGSTDDLELYSLETPIYPYVFNCPPGADCRLTETTESTTLICCGVENTIIYTPGTTVAQRQALLNAAVYDCARRMVFCGQLTQLPPAGEVSPNNNPPGPAEWIKLFYNTKQTCTVECPDGSEFTYTVAAGKYASVTQAFANQGAKNAACSMATDGKVCFLELNNPFACADVAYTGEIRAVGSHMAPAPCVFTYTVISGSLPTGVTLDSCTGNLSGTPSASGEYTFTIKAVGAPGYENTKEFTIGVVQISPSTITGLHSCEAFSQQLTLDGYTGDTALLTWAVASGSLPAGLSLDTATGIISGTPTQIQAANFTISVVVGSSTCSKDYSVSVTTGSCFSSGNPPDADTTPVAYSFTFVPVQEVVPGLMFSITSGSLPPGIGLNASTGEISGSPTTPGDYPFTIALTGGTCDCSADYSITAECQPDISGDSPGELGTLQLVGPGSSALTPAYVIQRTGAGRTLDLNGVGTVQSAAGIHTEYGIRLYNDETNVLIATYGGNSLFGGGGTCASIPQNITGSPSLSSCVRYRLEPYLTITGANPNACSTSLTFNANWV